jgi:hypothetical protein
MKTILHALLAALFSALAVAAAAADGVAFITNMKGEIALDGANRPTLMAELAKGQKISLAKEAMLAVMFIQSGKEFVLKGPGEYAIADTEIIASKGTPPAMRQTEWHTNSKVVVQVAQTAAASVRMRSIAPPKVEDKSARLLYPIQGNVSTLQPTFRWTATEAKAPYEFTISTADAPFHKAKVATESYRLPTKLKVDTEYAWAVTSAGSEVGSGKFRTLTKEDIAKAEKRKPSDKAEFSDRMMYALMLQEMGATQEAQEIWAVLAKERSDLSELANLAKPR